MVTIYVDELDVYNTMNEECVGGYICPVVNRVSSNIHLFNNINLKVMVSDRWLLFIAFKSTLSLTCVIRYTY